jgi:AraC-like DNA-binding protein
MIGFSGADYDVSWIGPDGRKVTQPITPDHVWILPAGVEQEIHWRQTADLIILFVEMAAVQAFCGQVPVHASVRPMRDYSDREPAIGMLCDELRRQARQVNFDSDSHVGAVGACLASFVARTYFAPGVIRAPHSGMKAADRARVEQHIMAHLSEPFSLDALAQAARLSRSHFCRRFKAETGFKPRDYFNRCRILRAQEMLATGGFNLSEVAFKLGFSELGHFTRVFRKVLHAPPRAFLPRKEKQPQKIE